MGKNKERLRRVLEVARRLADAPFPKPYTKREYPNGEYGKGRTVRTALPAARIVRPAGLPPLPKDIDEAVEIVVCQMEEKLRIAERAKLYIEKQHGFILQKNNEYISIIADKEKEISNLRSDRDMAISMRLKEMTAVQSDLETIKTERDRLLAELENVRQQAAERPETASPGAAGSSAAAENSARRWRDELAPAIMAAAVEFSPPSDGLQKVDIEDWLARRGVSGRGVGTVVNVVWNFLKNQK